MSVPLAIKAAVVFVMMIVVGVLTVIARRRNFEGVRRRYTTRRTRVAAPVDPSPPAPAEAPRNQDPPV